MIIGKRTLVLFLSPEERERERKEKVYAAMPSSLEKEKGSRGARGGKGDTANDCPGAFQPPNYRYGRGSKWRNVDAAPLRSAAEKRERGGKDSPLRAKTWKIDSLHLEKKGMTRWPVQKRGKEKRRGEDRFSGKEKRFFIRKRENTQKGGAPHLFQALGPEGLSLQGKGGEEKVGPIGVESKIRKKRGPASKPPA